MEQGNMAVQAPPAIYGAIAGVIADVGAVAKDKVNRQQGFKFRSIDDVYNALHPALAKNKVFIVPRILERDCSVVGKTQKGTDMVKVVCKIKFTFYAEDGSSVESVIIGEGLDTGDKATNKAMAIAYKYVCFQVFCIPTDDMADPDAESPELEGAVPAAGERTADKKNAGKKKAKPAETEGPAGKNRAGGESEGPDHSDVVRPADTKPGDMITPVMLQTIRAEQKRTGVTDQVILSRKSVKANSIETLSIEEFRYIMSVFEKTPDKKEAAHE